MEQHRKILGILNLVWGGLTALGGLIALVVLGGVAGFIDSVARDPDAWIAVSILRFVGTAVFVLMMVLSLPGVIAGYGLLNHRRWAPTVGIVVSALHLLNIPFGTLLGAYGLWVLMPRDGGGATARPAA